MRTTNRREFLTGAAAAGLAALPGAVSASDVVRKAGDTPKLRLSLAAYSFRDHIQGKLQPAMDLPGFIDLAAKYEVDAVELTQYYFPKEITQQYVAGLKRKAYLYGMDISGSPVGNTFTHPAGAARDKEIAHVKGWIDTVADLGAPCIRIFAGTLQAGQTPEDAQKNSIECIEIACEHAAKRGVILGLENHGGIVAEADSLLAIVKAVKSEWLGINLDTGNFHTADPYGDLEKCAPYAISCQLKTEIQAKGQPKGPADIKRLMDILRKTGYRGYVTLEYEAAEPPMTGVPKALADMRKAM